MSLLRVIFCIAAIVSLNFKLCFGTCARAEYEIHGECCPMCAPGNRVYWHCKEDTSTTCVPCPESTYTDEPNGLMKCLPCSVCDSVKGLRVKKACTRTSDVMCEPQERCYCIDQNKYGCTLAVKHSKCNPGQYIKQPGTTLTDTICASCTDGTFSNGSVLACQPHSKCDTMGLAEIQAGTLLSDAECGKLTPVTLVVGVTFVVAIIIMAPCIYFIFKHRKCFNKRRTPTQETEKDSHKHYSLKDIGGREGPSKVRQKKSNLEMAISIPLTNNSGEADKPENQLRKHRDLDTPKMQIKNLL